MIQQEKLTQAAAIIFLMKYTITLSIMFRHTAQEKKLNLGDLFSNFKKLAKRRIDNHL